ncbi:MAG TPA: TIGR03435 family protein [Bryobacteraceae bacterium]
MTTHHLVCACVAVAAAWGQASTPAFEVASVKPVGQVESGGAAGTPGSGGIGVGCDGHAPQVVGRRFTVTTTPYALITWAYGYNKTSSQQPGWGCSYISFADLLTGGPSWIRSERFEIQALIPEGAPTYTFEQFMHGDATGIEQMLQSLLADRFKLVVHHETKNVPAYALTIARSGSKLTTPKAEDRRMLGIRRHTDANGLADKLTGRKVEIRDLAFLLLLTTRQPVLDRTGLAGEFNFDAEFAPFDNPGDSTAPSLFTALQEQLGLKLETTKAPLDGLVIDRAERPSGN